MNREKELNNRTQMKEQVRASLDRYFGFMHSRINAISHLNIEEMDIMQRAGCDMNITKEAQNYCSGRRLNKKRRN